MGSKRDNWKKNIREWEVSGLSQKQYCNKNQISYDKFRYWKARINKVNPFVELPGIIYNNNTQIEIYLEEKKVAIRIPEIFNETTLRNIFKVLGV